MGHIIEHGIVFDAKLLCVPCIGISSHKQYKCMGGRQCGSWVPVKLWISKYKTRIYKKNLWVQNLLAALTFYGQDMKLVDESSCCKSRRRTVFPRCGFARGSAESTTLWRPFHSPSRCRCTASRQCGRACACGKTAGTQRSSHISCRSTESLLKWAFNQQQKSESCLCGVFCAFSGNIWWWISFHSRSSPTSYPRGSSCALPLIRVGWNPDEQMRWQNDFVRSNKC